MASESGSAASRDHVSDTLILFDFALDSFSCTVSPELHPTYLDVFVGFRHNGTLPAALRDLRRLNLSARDASGNPLAAFTYPPGPNITYVSTDQEYCFCDRVFSHPGSTVTIKVSLLLQYGREEFEQEITLPIPPQPYPSWTWDPALHRWVPPVPYPDDGKEYRWDEPTLSWIEVEGPRQQ